MRIIHLILMSAISLAGCKTEVKNQDSCGDDFRDPGEACDGPDLGGQDCRTLGFHENVGAPVCTARCAFDTSACGARCGDNTVDVAHGEECDSQQLSGNTCQTLGFTRGALACDADCRYDTSGCANVCGDGVAQTGEVCDGADLQGQSCAALGYYGGTLACATDCTLELASCELAGRCGDGARQSGEDCDGEVAVGVTCATEGLFSGDLSCTADCTLDLSGCHTAVALSAGHSHACILDDMGLAYCWGAGNYGRLGDGDIVNRFTPTAVTMPSGIAFSKISAGTSHTCALSADGRAWCWGYGQAGRLGNGTDENQRLPTPVTLPVGRTFTAITAGGAHTCAIDDLGHGWCWGNGDYYALGNDSTVGSLLPTPVTMPSATTFTAISAGNAHTCALTHTTTIRCWGLNAAGQIGNNATVDARTPAGLADGGRGYVDVHAGHATTCAVATGGDAYCWGYNNRGQVGDGTIQNRWVPTQVKMPLGVPSAKVTIHAIHACAVTTSGDLYCWGGGEEGELGLGGSTTATMEPLQVTSLPPGVSVVDAREKGTCALTAPGKAWCWGTNDVGQIGITVVSTFFNPTPVSSP